MNRDLHFSATAYGFGAGIFSLGYALFEVPSNLVLARVGARYWIARIMITYGHDGQHNGRPARTRVASHWSRRRCASCSDGQQRSYPFRT